MKNSHSFRQPCVGLVPARPAVAFRRLALPSWLLPVLLLLGGLLSPLACAQQAGDFRYSSDGSAITITGYTGAGGAVTIPGTIADLPVRTIGDGAFSNKTNITSVAIPDGITYIGISAFQGCGALTSVIIPNSVTSIRGFAFHNCINLTNLTIPDSVTSIGTWAFLLCKGLTSVTIPNNVTSIGDGAFSGCTNLLNIEVAPGNTTHRSVDGVLFNLNQTRLIQYPSGKTGGYVIPNSVTSIGVSAFWGCTGLARATFEGNAPASFGTEVFNGTAAGFTIYYHEGSTGFTSPTWNGYPAVMIGAPSVPTLEEWRKLHFGEGATNSGDAADGADPDGDGFINVEEYAAGTHPKSAASQLQMQNAARTGDAYTVAFDAQPGRRYELQRLIPGESAAWQTVATQEPPAAAGRLSLTDPAAPPDAAFYRVKATLP